MFIDWLVRIVRRKWAKDGHFNYQMTRKCAIGWWLSISQLILSFKNQTSFDVSAFETYPLATCNHWFAMIDAWRNMTYVTCPCWTTGFCLSWKVEQPFPNVKIRFNLQVQQPIISMDGHQLRKGGYVFYLYQDSLEVQPNKAWTRWWFQISFIFTPDLWGKWSKLTSIFFQMGWKKPPPRWMIGMIHVYIRIYFLSASCLVNLGFLCKPLNSINSHDFRYK